MLVSINLVTYVKVDTCHTTSGQNLIITVQVVQHGSIHAEAPLDFVSEARLKASEVQENHTVSTKQPLTCSVAFHRGQERSVLFTVHGMPQVRTRHACCQIPSSSTMVYTWPSPQLVC